MLPDTSTTTYCPVDDVSTTAELTLVLVDVTVTALYDDVVVPYVDEVYTTTT